MEAFGFIWLQNHDLVEVWLGDKDNHRAVWCIWVTNQGETAISYSLISMTNWVWASLQPPPPSERNLNPMIDPQQAYLDAIFEPGVFSVADINRALYVSYSVLVYNFYVFLFINCVYSFHLMSKYSRVWLVLTRIMILLAY